MYIYLYIFISTSQKLIFHDFLGPEIQLTMHKVTMVVYQNSFEGTPTWPLQRHVHEIAV